jgi:hypothetical protein
LPFLPLSGAALALGAVLAFGAMFALGSGVVPGSAPVAGAGAAMTATTPTIISAAAAMRMPAREAETRRVPPGRTGPWNSISGSGIGASVRVRRHIGAISNARVGPVPRRCAPILQGS